MPKTKNKELKGSRFKRLMMNRTFTVFDIETTGFSPEKGSRIIDIGAVKIVDGKIVDEFQELVDPRQPVPAKITQLTTITNDMIKGKPTIEEVLPKFMKFAGNSVLVAHNAQFEKRFIEHDCSRLGIYPKNEWLCTMKLFKFVNPERKVLGRKYKLDDLTEEYGIPFNEDIHHRAFPDAEATAKALLEIRRNRLDEDFINKELTTFPEEDDSSFEEVKKITDININYVNYWEKCINKKRDDWKRRVYVNMYHKSDKLNATGQAFYDLYTQTWEVKKFQDEDGNDIPVDTESIEKRMCQYVNHPSVKSYLNAQGVFKKAKQYLKDRTNDKRKFVEKNFPEAILINHNGYMKADIPYDEFDVIYDDSAERLFVTNEKRGSKYRVFLSKEDIK